MGGATNGFSTRADPCGPFTVSVLVALNPTLSGFCAAALDATQTSNTAARSARPAGGSVWESNPPNPTSSGRISFEDRAWHQPRNAPISTVNGNHASGNHLEKRIETI